MKIPTDRNCGYLDNKKIDLSLSSNRMERVMGIEPTRPAWKAGILPLNYTRILHEGNKSNLTAFPRE